MKEANPSRAVPPGLDCQEFLAGHTDYLDAVLDTDQMIAFEDHGSLCSACGRYDAVMRRGLMLVRNVPEVLPSAGFYARLEERLGVSDAEGREPMVANGRTAAVVAAVLAIVAVTPLVPLAMRERTAAAPPATYNLNADLPSFYGSVIAPQPAGLHFGSLSSSANLTSTGPNTPLIVQAPVVGMRTSTPFLISYPSARAGDR